MTRIGKLKRQYPAMNKAPLLIDTHIWLWWLLADSRLAHAPIRPVIEGAEYGQRLRLSAISLWESLLLYETGRVRWTGSARDWLDEARRRFVVHVLSVDERVAVESRLLPGTFHPDPADRFIVATARLAGATLVTADRRILDYAACGHVSALDPSGAAFGPSRP